MNKTEFRKTLHALRAETTLADKKTYEVCPKRIGYVATRSVILHVLNIWLEKIGGSFGHRDRNYTANDWLTLKPIYIKSESRNIDISDIVQNALIQAQELVGQGVNSLSHLALLYKLSRVIRLIDVNDERDVEFIKAVPRKDGGVPLREFTHGDFTCYFVDNRFVILLNRGANLKENEDDHYFVTAYDLGSIFAYIVENCTGMPSANAPTRLLQLEKFEVTTQRPVRNKHLVLSKIVKEPVTYGWFIYSNLHVRYTPYIINYKSVVIPNHSGVGIPNEDWKNLIREFGIPTSSKLNRNYENDLRNKPTSTS